MTSSLQDTVQFYLDRSRESVVTILRSIILNPRLTDEERLSALKQIVGHHNDITELVSARLAAGEAKGLSLAGVKINPTSSC